MASGRSEPIDLEFRMRARLEALHQHESQGERWPSSSSSAGSAAPRCSCTSAQRCADATRTSYRAGGAMLIAVLAGLVDVERVMRVLDRSDPQSARRCRAHQSHDEVSLAGVLASDDAVDLHWLAPVNLTNRESARVRSRKRAPRPCIPPARCRYFQTRLSDIASILTVSRRRIGCQV